MASCGGGRWTIPPGTQPEFELDGTLYDCDKCDGIMAVGL